jgi:hypothetical protein
MEAFMQRFGSDPGAFEPRRDGIVFMQTVRRLYQQQYGQAWRSVVGGLVQLTTVARDSITTQVVHHWPDKVGHPIVIDGGPVDPDKTFDDGWPGMTMTQIYQMREGLVARSAEARAYEARPRSTIADLQKVTRAVNGR